MDNENNNPILQGFDSDRPADGSHWRTLAEQADEFRSLGLSAVWIPPAYKGATGMNSNGYDVYDLYDLGEFNQKGNVQTKFGTKNDLQAAIRALHQAGIEVYADIVLNHRTGADEEDPWALVEEVNSRDRNSIVNPPRRESIWTRFIFPERAGCYSSFQWNTMHFTGCEESKDGYSRLFWFLWKKNKEGKQPRILRIAGKHWAEDVDLENGNFDFLMGCDIDHSNPEVREELVRWGEWFLDTTHVDGFRLDAVKHISAGFYRDWLPEMRHYAGRNLFAVGEYASGDLSRLNTYLERVNRNMSLFDFPLHYRFREASLALREKRNFDLRSLFAGTLVAEHPENAVTFVDNHDTQFGGGGLESPVLWEFQVSAYAFTLLRAAGRPCVFWRDLYGVPNSGDGVVRELRRLLKIRRLSAKGEDVSVVDKGPNLVGFVRLGIPGDCAAGVVCAISNDSEDRLFPFRLPSHFYGRRFRCVIGDRPNVTVSEAGYADFSVGAKRCAVFIPEEAAATLDAEQ